MSGTQAAVASRSPKLFRAESLTQSLGVYLPATLVARCVGLGRGIVLAWLISEIEFGLYQIGLLAIILLQPLLSVGLTDAMARYVPLYETRGVLRSFLQRSVMMALGITAALSVMAIALARPLGRFLFETLSSGEAPAAGAQTYVGLAWVVVGATAGQIAYFLCWSVLRGLRMFRAVSLLELAQSLVFTGLAVSMAVAGWRTAGVLLGGYGLVLLGAALVFTPGLAKVVNDEASSSPPEPLADSPLGWPMAARLLKFSSWVALATLAWQGLQYYPMWHLHKTCGQEGEVTAVFAGVRLLTQGVLVAAVAVVTVVQTSVTKTWEAHGREEADRRLVVAFKVTALGLLLAAAAMTLAGPLIIRLLPRGYAGGVEIIPPLLVFFLLCGELALLGIHFHLIERTRTLFIVWLVGLVASIGIGVGMVRPGLAPAIALSSAAWAGVLGVSIGLLTMIVVLRLSRRPIDVGACLLIGGSYLPALPGVWLAVSLGIGTLLIVMTSAVLTRQEKREARERLAAGLAGARRFFSRTGQ